MNEMTNQETDTALILENELKRRVNEAVQQVAYEIVRKEMREMFIQQKDSMLMEVSITVGKHLRLIENEGRKPLWEATPEEFVNLSGVASTPNRHNIDKELPHAIRE